MKLAEELLADLEQAAAETQRAAVYSVLVYAHKQEWLTDAPYDLAMRWWNVGAYESAALRLVGDGWEWAMEYDSGEARVHLGDPSLLMDGIAATPALAICIASIRARQASGEAGK